MSSEGVGVADRGGANAWGTAVWRTRRPRRQGLAVVDEAEQVGTRELVGGVELAWATWNDGVVGSRARDAEGGSTELGGRCWREELGTVVRIGFRSL
ncbi:uncharacterized protein A4U43_C04F28660 [Asparagus officinalis]|uniref:Uncharacterized protein n=1 Tax=Asparagus officinalis TaxID=4686 RepID=A0A5P1F4C0_ASPOF|nr:uncharacterized protein A4U43_C04F28660 [Asparagus officinalis]